MNKDFALSVVLTGLGSYLIQGFTLFQWNPAEWERIDRITLIAIWALSIIISKIIKERLLGDWIVEEK